MISDLKNDIDYASVDDIFACQNIAEMKAAVAGFLSATEKVRDTMNGMSVYMLCRRLEKAFAEWSKQYLVPAKGAAWNAVIVPPEHSPTMLLPSCVPFGAAPIEIINGLKRFMERCDEFTEPVHEGIALSEMKRVLTSTQKTYRIPEIIAPDKPLMILRFNNSHIVHNSQCAIPSDNEQAVIISLCPKQTEIHDSVFIFAHELGHALHLSLTHDIDVLPEGFDKFNDSFSLNPKTLKEKQEAFADAVALAILNAKGLGTHFPTQFSKDMSHVFARYMRGLCECALRKAGRYSEPLPSPNLPWKSIPRPPH